jgi:Sulfotransferase family
MSWIVEKIFNAYAGLYTREQIEIRLAYNTYVSIKHKYMYMCVQKAASTSIKTAVQTIENLTPITPIVDGPLCTERVQYVHKRHRFPMQSIIDFSDKEQQDIIEGDWFCFSVIRDPVDRVISYWQDMVYTCEPEAQIYFERLGRDIPPPQFNESDLISLSDFIDVIEDDNLYTCDPHYTYTSSYIFSKALDLEIYDVSEISTLQKDWSSYLGYPVEIKKYNESYAFPTFYQRDLDRLEYLYRGDKATIGYLLTSKRKPFQPFELDAKLKSIIERNITSKLLHTQWAELAKPVIVPYM